MAFGFGATGGGGESGCSPPNTGWPEPHRHTGTTAGRMICAQALQTRPISARLARTTWPGCRPAAAYRMFEPHDCISRTAPRQEVPQQARRCGGRGRRGDDYGRTTGWQTLSDGCRAAIRDQSPLGRDDRDRVSSPRGQRQLGAGRNHGQPPCDAKRSALHHPNSQTIKTIKAIPPIRMHQCRKMVLPDSVGPCAGGISSLGGA